MTDSPHTALQRVLVPIDFSPLSLRALEYATNLFSLAEGAELHLLHVVTALPFSPGFLSFSDEAQAEKLLVDIKAAVDSKLDALAGEARARGGVTVTTATRDSQAPYAAILEYAQDHAADLIVMGSHGRSGVGYIVLGSIAGQVACHAPCSVFVVRRDQREFIDDRGQVNLRRILVPSDMSEEAMAAIAPATALRARFGAEILSCHIEDPEREAPPCDPEDWLPGLQDFHPLRGAGQPAEEIVAFAEERDIDLIVMASRGCDAGPHRVLGSVSDRVLRHAPCAVYLVR